MWYVRTINIMKNGEVRPLIQSDGGTCREGLYYNINNRNNLHLKKEWVSIKEKRYKITWTGYGVFPHKSEIIQNIVDSLNENGFGPIEVLNENGLTEFIIPANTYAPVLSSYLGAFIKFYKVGSEKKKEKLPAINLSQYVLVCCYFSTFSPEYFNKIAKSSSVRITRINGINTFVRKAIEVDPERFVDFIKEFKLKKLVRTVYSEHLIKSWLKLDLGSNSW